MLEIMPFSKSNKILNLSITAVLVLSSSNYSTGSVYYRQEKKSMLYWASLLVSHITSANTDYRHKETLVRWGDDKNDKDWQGYADCSGFINSLLKKTYGLDDTFLKSWLGKTRPLAFHYFDAIVAGSHFRKIDKISEVQPGDLLVIKYSDRSEHEDNTGHCMLVASSPHRRVASKLLEPGTEQYEITVIDASKSPHGKTDTRHTENGDGFAGLGKGVLRLYAGKDGSIKGYSWSTLSPKEDFDPLANPVIAGRIEL